MDQQIAEVKFTGVTPEVLTRFLATATRRIVIAKAGYAVTEVKQLIELAKRKDISVLLYMEAGENAIRYGFGESEALPLLKEHMHIINVQSVNQIRMALVIVDDTALVYAPVALSWEKAPAELEFPNGFFGGKTITESLFKQMGGESIVLSIEEKLETDASDKEGQRITIPVPPIPKKKPEKIKEEIERSSKALDENPPIDPTTLRNTTFYRNKYKLLKATVHGANVRAKSLDLRPFNTMFPETDSRLRSSWSVLKAQDAKELPTRNFLTAIEKEIESLTFNAGRHGKLIKRQDKDGLEAKINGLAEELQKKLEGKIPVLQQSAISGAPKDLKSILDDSKSSLIKFLSPLASNREQCLNKLFAHERTLFKKMQNKEVSKEKAIAHALETFVEDVLHFPTSAEIIESIDVKFDYYDVSDELLADEEFIEKLQEFDVEVREYNKGFEKKS